MGDNEIRLKRKIVRLIGMFFLIMIVFTGISRTVYIYLLPLVQVADAGSGRIENKIVLEGEIGLDKALIEKRLIEIESKLAGEVKSCTIEEGDKVKEGQVLFTIQKELTKDEKRKNELEKIQIINEKESLRRQKENLKKELENVKNQYIEKTKQLIEVENRNNIITLEEEIKNQDEQVKINKNLYEMGTISNKQYKESMQILEEKERKKEELLEVAIQSIEKEKIALTLSINNLSSELKDLQGELEVVDKRLNLTQLVEEEVIVAPIDGYIGEINIYTECAISQGEQLMVIVPEDIPYRLTFELPIIKAKDIKLGQEVRWKFDNKKRKAVITQKKISQDQQAYSISCELSQEILEELKVTRDVYLGVLVEISNKFDEYPCVVPNSALIYEENKDYVYITEPYENVWGKKHKAKKLTVDIIKQGDYYTAIEAIIPKNSQIITGTSKPLKEDVEVNLR